MRNNNDGREELLGYILKIKKRREKKIGAAKTFVSRRKGIPYRQPKSSTSNKGDDIH